MILRSPAAGPRRVPLRLFAVTAVALAGMLAAGCEAGNHSPTQQWHQPTDGAGTDWHGISIRNVFILGAAPAEQLPAGSDTGMFLALYNNTNTPDKLIGIRVPAATSTVQLPNDSAVTLPPHTSVLLTGPEPKVVLRNLTRAVPGGTFFNTVLTFQNAGSVVLSVPVMPTNTPFATFSPAPTPTPTPTPSVTATPGHHKHKHHKHGAGASPTPSPSTS